MLMESELKRTIGANIRYARQKRRLTQQHLANLLGVSRPWVTRIEAGVLELSATRLIQIANILQLSLNVLAARPANGPPPDAGKERACAS